MKITNAIVCVCLILAQVGCAAQRPYSLAKPAEAAGSEEPAPAVTASPEREHPMLDKCRTAAGKVAIVVTAPIWVPVLLWYYPPGR
jgi:hypothetical protein